MTQLVVNVPDTAEGTPVEVFPYGVFKVGETVDLGYQVYDANGDPIDTIYCYTKEEPPTNITPVSDDGMDADDTPQDEEA